MWVVDEPVVWRICLDSRVEEDWAEWFAVSMDRISDPITKEAMLASAIESWR